MKDIKQLVKIVGCSRQRLNVVLNGKGNLGVIFAERMARLTATGIVMWMDGDTDPQERRDAIDAILVPKRRYVARIARVSPQHLSNVLRGHARCGIRAAHALSRVTGWDVETWLLAPAAELREKWETLRVKDLKPISSPAGHP